MTAPDTTTVLDEHLEAQLQPPCEIERVRWCPVHGSHVTDCPDPATWVLRTPCACGTTDICLICNEHARDARGRADCVVVCSGCGAPTPPDRVHLERL